MPAAAGATFHIPPTPLPPHVYLPRSHAANGRVTSTMSSALRMQPAAPALRTINSETNMAVQLLAALRASPPPPMPPPPPRAGRHSMTDDDDDDRTAVASDTSGSVLGSPPLARAAAAAARSSRGGTAAVAHGPAGETTLYKYSRAERQEALRRFKEKKRLRSFKKTIRYDVRKRLADTRPRYKGRFSKPPAGACYDDGTPGPLA